MSVKEKSAVDINHDVDAKIEEGVSLEVPQLTWVEQFQALWSCKRAAAACKNPPKSIHSNILC